MILFLYNNILADDPLPCEHESDLVIIAMEVIGIIPASTLLTYFNILADDPLTCDNESDLDNIYIYIYIHLLLPARIVRPRALSDSRRAAPIFAMI